MTWLDRFYETNKKMMKLCLGDTIVPIASGEHHEGDHSEGADPHYWVSPQSAIRMAGYLKNFLVKLNPGGVEKYETNYLLFLNDILKLDQKARNYFSNPGKKVFMIYHPNLGYMARDYGLEEIPVEYEGKEPSPSRMKMLIDLARKDSIRDIFVQREYDTRNAKAIAREAKAQLVIIDPLSEDWLKTTSDILDALRESLK
jgi:zinc transport system substrate-binding protein